MESKREEEEIEERKISDGEKKFKILLGFRTSIKQHKKK